jgi:hypothetical protein
VVRAQWAEEAIREEAADGAAADIQVVAIQAAEVVIPVVVADTRAVVAEDGAVIPTIRIRTAKAAKTGAGQTTSL